MKLLLNIAGMVLAGAFAVTAQADPSKGEIMTLCKAEIKASFDDVTRVRTTRFKDRASGTFISFRVSTEDADAQNVTCTFKEGFASLTDASGAMIAGKTSQENTDS